MRGRVDAQSELFHTFNLEELIPADHPLREIKKRADAVLAGMSRQFNAACGRTGRPGIPPERLIKAMLLMALYSIRSERQLCEQTAHNPLFRGFLDLWRSANYGLPRSSACQRGPGLGRFHPRRKKSGLPRSLASPQARVPSAADFARRQRSGPPRSSA